MRYYKLFHTRPHVYAIAFVFGSGCVVAAFVMTDPSLQLTALACGLVGLYCAYVLWRGRSHFLDIDREWIYHHGNTRWRLRKAEVTRIEQGTKGLAYDYDPFLKVHAGIEAYDVDDGFLTGDERIQELANAMRPQGFQ